MSEPQLNGLQSKRLTEPTMKSNTKDHGYKMKVMQELYNGYNLRNMDENKYERMYKEVIEMKVKMCKYMAWSPRQINVNRIFDEFTYHNKLCNLVGLPFGESNQIIYSTYKHIIDRYKTLLRERETK